MMQSSASSEVTNYLNGVLTGECGVDTGSLLLFV